MKCADEPQMCYGTGMRRNAKSLTTSPEIVSHIHGLTEANFNMMTRLITWLTDKEKRQRKFECAVINKLTRINSTVSLLLVGQMAQTQSSRPWFHEDKLQEDAKKAEEFIAKQTREAGIKTVEYIYKADPVSYTHLTLPTILRV